MNKIDSLIATLPIVENFDGDQQIPYTFVRPDSLNVLRISAEHTNSYLFLDYYGNYRGGYPWIHPTLMAWATEHKGFWEWENPSNIAFYEL